MDFFTPLAFLRTGEFKMKFVKLSLPLLLSFFVCAHAESKLTLALNWKPEPQFGGFYAAEFEGYFKKNKLDVTIQQGGSGTPTVQMVAAGKAEFAIVSADEVLLSRQNGSDVIALYAVYHTNPQGIMTHAERNLKNIGEIYSGAGTLSIQSGLPYSDFLKKKYPKAKVKIVPYAGGISTFLADTHLSQQCFVTSEPLAAKKAGKSVSTFLIADEGYNPYTTVVVTREKYWKENPEIVKKFVQAVDLGWKSYLKFPDKTNRKMFELNPSMDLETFAASAQAQLPLIEPKKDTKMRLGEIDQTRWRELETQLLTLGVLKKADLTKSTFVPYSQLIF